jgi:hypothetical protein
MINKIKFFFRLSILISNQFNNVLYYLQFFKLNSKFNKK